jgi:hypothetical protein
LENWNNLPRYFLLNSIYTIRSPGLVGTRSIDRLRHRSFKFNPALLELSIGNWNTFKTRRQSTDWKNNHQRRNWKTVSLRIRQFAFTRFKTRKSNAIFCMLYENKYDWQIATFLFVRWSL